MEETEDHKEGVSKESDNMVGVTREEKPDLDASEIGKGEKSGGGENSESHQSPAIDDLADGHNHEDDSADGTQQPTHQPPTGAGKPQTKWPDRRTGRRVSLTVEELEEEWSLQKSEINSLDERRRRAQEELESFMGQNEAERDALKKDLSDVKKCKKQVELEKEELEKALNACFLENERLEDSADALRQRLQVCVAEVLKQMSAKDGLTKTIPGLREDLDTAKVELKEREKAIEDLKAQIQRFAAGEMKNKVLEKVVDRLENDLRQAQKQNGLLRAQLRDMTTELHEHPAAQREDERTSASLDDEAKTFVADAKAEERSASLGDEMEEVEAFGATDQGEDAEQISGDAAESSTGTQALEPDARADKPSTDMHAVDVPSAASTQTQEPEAKTNEAITGAQRVTPTSPKGERPSKESISSPNTVQTGDTATSYAEIRAVNFEVSTESMQPIDTPRMEIDLSLSEKYLTSPISGTPVMGTGPLSAAEENTPELTNGRLVPPLGSPVWVPRTPRSDFRFGIAELPTLDSTVSKVEKWTTSRNSDIDTDGNRTDNGDQTEDQSTQTRTTDGNLEEGKGKSSGAAAIPYSSIAWWMLLLGLALSWWLSEDHQKLWMQANEATRQTVVGLRDERWAEPPWLARMSFTAENVLQIDRSMLA